MKNIIISITVASLVALGGWTLYSATSNATQSDAAHSQSLEKINIIEKTNIAENINSSKGANEFAESHHSVNSKNQGNTQTDSPYTWPTLIANSDSEKLEYIQSAPPSDKARLLTESAVLANNSQRKKQDAESLLERFEQYMKSNPKDAEMHVALGSLTSLMATFYPNNVGKMSLYGKRGNRLMDRAIKNAPNHLGARLQRGINSASVPAFLNRARYAVEDLQLIKSVIGEQNGPSFSSMVDYYLAMALMKSNQNKQAKQLLETVIQRTDPEWSIKAQQLKEQW